MKLLCFSFLLLLSGCSFQSQHIAPVTVVTQSYTSKNTYTVMPGDTLYSIAWAYNINPERILRENNLLETDVISAGQKLIITGFSKNIHYRGSVPVIKSNVLKTKQIQNIKQIKHKRVKLESISHKWIWPKCKIFAAEKPFKGVWMKLNTVPTIMSGVVVYNGSGLKGYGHVVIVKHGKYLAAYGHLTKVRVKLHEKVHAQQIIAMARDHANGIYFELRRQGVAVDLSHRLS